MSLLLLFNASSQEVEGEAADGLTISDSATSAASLTLTGSDTVLLSEAGSQTVDWSLAGFDTLSLSDAAGPSLRLLVAASDPLSLSDSAIAKLTFLQGIADQILLGEAISAHLEAMADAGEAITFSDFATPESSGIDLLYDSIPLADQGLANVDTQVPVVQALALSDTMGWGASEFGTAVGDSLTFYDEMKVGQVGHGDENLVISESVELSAELFYSIGDGVSISDSGVLGRLLSDSPHDGFILTDTGAHSVQMLVHAVEGMSLSDAFFLIAEMGIPLEDMLDIQDSADGVIGEFLAEEFSLEDNADMILDADIGLADSVLLVDEVKVTDVSVLQDEVFLSDSATARADFVESVSQFVAVIDIYTYGRLGRLVEIVEVEVEIQNDLWGSNAKFL